MKEKGTTGVWIGIVTSLIAISAWIRIPMYPVALTMQVFIILLIPMVFGTKISFYGVLLYIILGLIGLPIFSSGGGIASLLKPSFGYLLGYLFSVLVNGYILSYSKSLANYIFACIASLFTIYLFGVTGLYFNINFIQLKEISMVEAIKIGCILFLVADIIKVTMVVMVAPALTKVFSKKIEKLNNKQVFNNML